MNHFQLFSCRGTRNVWDGQLKVWVSPGLRKQSPGEVFRFEVKQRLPATPPGTLQIFNSDKSQLLPANIMNQPKLARSGSDWILHDTHWLTYTTYTTVPTFSPCSMYPAVRVLPILQLASSANGFSCLLRKSLFSHVIVTLGIATDLARSLSLHFCRIPISRCPSRNWFDFEDKEILSICGLTLWEMPKGCTKGKMVSFIFAKKIKKI